MEVLFEEKTDFIYKEKNSWKFNFNTPEET